MAQMIPATLPSHATVGEQRLYRALAKLPDDVIVYAFPRIKGREPDFIVILPEHGVIVIEVKGWRPGELVRADPNNIVLLRHGASAEETVTHPLEQARRYMFRLMDSCRSHPEMAALLQSSGPYAGRLAFPFGHMVALSRISREQLNDSIQHAFDSLFPVASTVTADELKTWPDLPREAVLAALVRRFDPVWPIMRMDKRRIDVLRSVIHPELLIGPTRLSPGAVADSSQPTLKILDLRQEQSFRSIGGGHRVLYGISGSGKTVMLIARAKQLAENADKRILMLCFNRLFAASLANTLRSHANITVSTFDTWAGKLGPKRGNQEDMELYGERLLVQLRQQAGRAGVYDALLIDEAQDFPCSWFQCARLALKDPENGDLLVVGDGSQALYRKRPFTWAAAGIKAQGRVLNTNFDLDRNYRNTFEILAASASFARPPSAADDDTAILSMQVSPSAADRHGPWPYIRRARDRIDEADQAADMILDWLANGLDVGRARVPILAENIAVLYPRAPRDVQAARTHLRRRLAKAGVKTKLLLRWPHGDGSIVDPGLAITTMHAVKGLQFKAVLLLWTDLLPRCFPDQTDAENRGLLYVSMTRAEDVLVILHSGLSPYIAEIADNIAKSQTATNGID